MVRALDNMYDIIDSNLIAINIPEKKIPSISLRKESPDNFPNFRDLLWFLCFND